MLSLVIPEKNCLSCTRFVSCTNKKGFGIICDNYKENILSTNDFFKNTGDTASIIEDKEVKIKELNFIELLEEALHPQSRSLLNIKIDDRDLPSFKNFYQFYSYKGYTTLYPRQFLIGTHLFSEWCPNCTPKKLANIEGIPVDYNMDNLLDEITLLEDGVCPKCEATKTQLFNEGKLNFYQELSGCAGQKAGKSILVAWLSSYLLYRFLKLGKPTEAYGLDRNTLLTGTFVGLTFKAVVKLLWAPFYKVLKSHPWFIDYHVLLNYYSDKYGEELYRERDQIISYICKDIILYPSSPLKRTLRGDNRMFYGIDEWGWFPNDSDKRERAGAEEVYMSLDRSLLTIRNKAEQLLIQGFYNIPNAFGFNVSSPSSPTDAIMTAVKTHKYSKKIYVFHAPSWEINPTITRNSSVIQNAYDDNPIKAERDYGANPPLNESPYMSDTYHLKNIFCGRKNRVLYKHATRISRGKKNRFAKITTFLRNKRANRIMGLDTGYSDNSFSIATGYVKSSVELEKYNYKNIRKSVCVIDSVIEIQPMKGEAKLDFTLIQENIIYPLIENLNVKYVISDHWQHLKILSDISNKYEIPCVSYTLTYEDHIYIRDLILSGSSKDSNEEAPNEDDVDERIILPRLEMPYKEVLEVDTLNYPKVFLNKPISHLFFQFTSASDNGNCVTKGKGFTDDILRAVLLCLVNLMDNDVQGFLEGLGEINEPDRRPIALGVVTTASGITPVTYAPGLGRVVSSGVR